jgi:hypothetical protein
MKKSYFFFLFFALLTLGTFAQTQTFLRTQQIPAWPVGGFGNIVAGVDLDGDGKIEIYACNSNAVDLSPDELIPRVWKFEWNGTKWDSVWGAVAPEIQLQNTWPGLTVGDLDGDGRKELIWAPVNFLDAATNPNPARILVYESIPGSDNMGVSDGFGGWLPNTKTTIVAGTMVNLRAPILIVKDVDGDGKQEVMFPDRAASSGNYHYCILSVSNVPNNGGGETWTIEGSGDVDPILAGTGNKWDMAELNGILYLFNSDGSKIFPVKRTGANWAALPAQVGLGGASGSFRTAMTLDVNGDNTKEIVSGQWIVTGGDTAAIYLFKQQGDTLAKFKIANLRPYGAYRLSGSAYGDVDNDGKMDMIFGTRYDVNQKPNNAVYRLEYQGGDITSPANYTISVIDSLYYPVGCDIDIIAVANLDGDPAKEIAYSSSYPRGNANNQTMNIVILDTKFTPVGVKADHKNIPDNFTLEQNFPNPFNPTTSIKFGVPSESVVDLAIYSVTGEKVRTLIDTDMMDAGNYTLEFNAEGLPSGTYLYTLKAGDYSLTKKMTLLK